MNILYWYYRSKKQKDPINFASSHFFIFPLKTITNPRPFRSSELKFAPLSHAERAVFTELIPINKP
jgi:hypothetical protein